MANLDLIISVDTSIAHLARRAGQTGVGALPFGPIGGGC